MQESALRSFINSSIRYRWSSALAVLGYAAIFLLLMYSQTQETEPHLSINYFFSPANKFNPGVMEFFMSLGAFTLCVYLYDSYADAIYEKKRGRNAHSSNETAPWRFLTLSISFGLFAMYTAEPLGVLAKHRGLFGLGAIFIAFYFSPLATKVKNIGFFALPLKWIYVSTLITVAVVIFISSFLTLNNLKTHPLSYYCSVIQLFLLVLGNLVLSDFKDSRIDSTDGRKAQFLFGYLGANLILLILMLLWISTSLVRNDSISLLEIAPGIFCFGVLLLGLSTKNKPFLSTIMADLSPVTFLVIREAILFY
ncbi:MAG: hypothetical protein GWP39_08915 [Planctomycetia bacterium]|nr:hypothetical protein [Planctomycetia bacterium]